MSTPTPNQLLKPGDRDLLGAVVLCGGQSRRMGRPKALLRFGGETLLQRVCRILHSCVRDLVVVGAPKQSLPRLPETVRVVSDEVAFQGPLSGIAQGLKHMHPACRAAFVCSCDIPLLEPDVVRLLAGEFFARDCEAVAVTDAEFLHPLLAVYSVRLAAAAQRLLDQGIRKPRLLLEQSRTVTIPAEALRTVDPELRSLMNLNTPDDYTAALQHAGLPVPDAL